MDDTSPTGQMMVADNSLSPHGGELKVSVATSSEAAHRVFGLPRLAVNDQIAREVINLAHGVFSPLEGFMAAPTSTRWCEPCVWTTGWYGPSQ